MAYCAAYALDENGTLRKAVSNAGVGFVLPYYGVTAPPGTLACDGSEISREAYPELFAALGTLAGEGDGSTTFNLPDLRGMFIRGTGGANSEAVGMGQGDAIRNITGQVSFTAGNVALAVDRQTVFTYGAFYPVGQASNVGQDYSIGSTYTTYRNAGFDAALVVPTAAENRPVNVALLWCIIYE